MSNAVQSSETQRNAMNSNEMQENSLNFTETQQNAVSSTETQSGFFKLGEEQIPIGDKTKAHTKTLKQAHDMFLAADVDISPSTLWRKCLPDKKSGLAELDAIKDKTLNIIFVTDESIISAIKQEIHRRNIKGSGTIIKPTNDLFSTDQTLDDNSNAYKKLKVDYEALQERHHQLKEDSARDKGMLTVYERNWKDMNAAVVSIARTVAQEIGSNVGRLEESKKVTEVIINDEGSPQSNEP